MKAMPRARNIDEIVKNINNLVAGIYEEIEALKRLLAVSQQDTALTLSDDIKIFTGDARNGNYFVFNSTDNQWEFYRNWVLKNAF